jgi:beta-phosphoglucomutase-like phosphatase (HAD superfamily)
MLVLVEDIFFYYLRINRICQAKFFDNIYSFGNNTIMTNQSPSQQPKTHYLIFDFDGVIADSLDSMAFAMKRAWPQFRFFPTRFIRKIIVDFVNKPVHSRKQNVSEQTTATIIRDYQHIANVLIAQGRTQVFEGFVAQIRQFLNAHNCKLAIVSSGSEIYINNVLHNINLPFEHIYGAETSLSKEHKVEMVCHHWKIDLKQCIYFTDSKTDVIELNHILDLKQIIGCSWGWQGFKKLNQVLPENQILREFSDFDRVVFEVEV